MYIHEKEKSRFRLFAQGLVRFPTGNAHTIPAIGTGTYRNRLGLSGDYDTEQFGVYVASVYEYSLNTHHGLRSRDLFECTLTLKGKLSKNISCMAVTDYYTLLKNSKNRPSGVVSGESILYIGPEASYHDEHIKISGAAQTPVFRDKLKLEYRTGFFVTVYF